MRRPVVPVCRGDRQAEFILATLHHLFKVSAQSTGSTVNNRGTVRGGVRANPAIRPTQNMLGQGFEPGSLGSLGIAAAVLRVANFNQGHATFASSNSIGAMSSMPLPESVRGPVTVPE